MSARKVALLGLGIAAAVVALLLLAKRKKKLKFSADQRTEHFIEIAKSVTDHFNNTEPSENGSREDLFEDVYYNAIQESGDIEIDGESLDKSIVEKDMAERWHSLRLKVKDSMHWQDTYWMITGMHADEDITMQSSTDLDQVNTRLRAAVHKIAKYVSFPEVIEEHIEIRLDPVTPDLYYFNGYNVVNLDMETAVIAKIFNIDLLKDKAEADVVANAKPLRRSMGMEPEWEVWPRHKDPGVVAAYWEKLAELLSPAKDITMQASKAPFDHNGREIHVGDDVKGHFAGVEYKGTVTKFSKYPSGTLWNIQADWVPTYGIPENVALAPASIFDDDVVVVKCPHDQDVTMQAGKVPVPHDKYGNEIHVGDMVSGVGNDWVGAPPVDVEVLDISTEDDFLWRIYYHDEGTGRYYNYNDSFNVICCPHKIKDITMNSLEMSKLDINSLEMKSLDDDSIILEESEKLLVELYTKSHFPSSAADWLKKQLKKRSADPERVELWLFHNKGTLKLDKYDMYWMLTGERIDTRQQDVTMQSNGDTCERCGIKFPEEELPYRCEVCDGDFCPDCITNKDGSTICVNCSNEDGSALGEPKTQQDITMAAIRPWLGRPVLDIDRNPLNIGDIVKVVKPDTRNDAIKSGEKFTVLDMWTNTDGDAYIKIKKPCLSNTINGMWPSCRFRLIDALTKEDDVTMSAVKTFKAPKREEERSSESSEVCPAKHGTSKAKDGAELRFSARSNKKRERVYRLFENMRRLRLNYKRDLKSSDEKLVFTALAVALMDHTAERVGNEDSARQGHYGITGLKCKHVRVKGNKVHLDYVGKSGVEHEKSFSDHTLARIIKKRLKCAEKKSEPLLMTSDGFHVKADKVNRYLAEFDISAKDIRGYLANRYMTEKMRDVDKDMRVDEKHRKKAFLSNLKKVAKKVGHLASTLRKHYLLPEFEPDWIEHGKLPGLVHG